MQGRVLACERQLLTLSFFVNTLEEIMMKKTLLLASALVIGLTLGACSDDDNSKGSDQPSGQQPGGEQPGGQQPGGQQPGGEQPGGEQPGGEQPGKTDAPLCDRFPNFKKAWLDAFGRNTPYYYCNEFAKAGVKERLDNALSKDGVTDDEVTDAFLTCPMDWLKTDQELYERVESYVNKCLSVCPKKGFDSACKKTEHCFMEMCIKETGVKKTCTDDPTICNSNQQCINGECKDKAPAPNPEPNPTPNPSGKSCNDAPNFKAALVSVVKTAYAADSCTTLDDDQDVGPAIQQDSLTETDVESMLANCLSSWLSSEPNGQALIEFVKSCEDEGV